MSEVRAVIITAYTPASELRQEFSSLKLCSEQTRDLELAVLQGDAEPPSVGMWLCQGWPPPEGPPQAPTTSHYQHCKRKINMEISGVSPLAIPLEAVTKELPKIVPGVTDTRKTMSSHQCIELKEWREPQQKSLVQPLALGSYLNVPILLMKPKEVT
jgi:hypothetical protein